MRDVTLEACCALIRKQEDEIRGLRKCRLRSIDEFLRLGARPSQISEVTGVSLGLVFQRKRHLAKLP